MENEEIREAPTEELKRALKEMGKGLLPIMRFRYGQSVGARWKGSGFATGDQTRRLIAEMANRQSDSSEIMCLFSDINDLYHTIEPDGEKQSQESRVWWDHIWASEVAEHGWDDPDRWEYPDTGDKDKKAFERDYGDTDTLPYDSAFASGFAVGVTVPQA